MNASSTPTSKLIVLWLACTLFLSACGNEPTETWSKEHYAKHKPMIDQVVKEMTQAFDAFAPVPFQDFEESAREELRTAQEKRRDIFDEASVKILEKHKNLIIGWEIYYTFSEPKTKEDKKKTGPKNQAIQFFLPKSSEHKPSYRGDTVRTERRNKVVDKVRKLAWGMYQVPGKERKTTLGMEALAYHPGYEVMIPFVKGKAKLELFLFIVPATE